MQIKPGFTDFRFCTPSLGRLQNFVLIEYSFWEKMLCIKLPKTHQIFKKHSCNTENSTDFSKTKDNLIWPYDYIYLELP